MHITNLQLTIPLAIPPAAIAPKLQKNHSGLLNPKILMVSKRSKPIEIKALANASTCSLYCFHVQLVQGVSPRAIPCNHEVTISYF